MVPMAPAARTAWRARNRCVPSGPEACTVTPSASVSTLSTWMRDRTVTPVSVVVAKAPVGESADGEKGEELPEEESEAS